MLPRNDPDRIQITFDDHRLVANAGLILPATLALHLGLPQLALFATYSYHGFITDREGETLALEADHRRHAEIENAIRDLKYGVGLNHLPSGRFPANPEPAEGRLAGGAGDRPQPGTLDGAHRSGRADRDHQDPATPLLFHGRKAHPLGAPPHFASAPALALGSPVQWRPR